MSQAAAASATQLKAAQDERAALLAAAEEARRGLETAELQRDRALASARAAAQAQAEENEAELLRLSAEWQSVLAELRATAAQEAAQAEAARLEAVEMAEALARRLDAAEEDKAAALAEAAHRAADEKHAEVEAAFEDAERRSGALVRGVKQKAAVQVARAMDEAKGRCRAAEETMRHARMQAEAAAARERASFEAEMTQSKRELARAMITIQRLQPSLQCEWAGVRDEGGESLPLPPPKSPAWAVAEAVHEPIAKEVASAAACAEVLIEDARRLDGAVSELHARVVHHAASELCAQVIDHAAEQQSWTSASSAGEGPASRTIDSASNRLMGANTSRDSSARLQQRHHRPSCSPPVRGGGVRLMFAPSS